MIVLPFLAGGTSLVAAVLLRRLWLASPPRSVCPGCGEATSSVTHALSARTDRWLKRRWCSACGWTGWGRNGPVLWAEKGPVAHDSGFRWGEDRTGPDFGFRWRDRRTATTTAAGADHPSGFRFRPIEPAAAAPDQDHPSGFRWKG